MGKNRAEGIVGKGGSVSKKYHVAEHRQLGRGWKSSHSYAGQKRQHQQLS